MNAFDVNAFDRTPGGKGYIRRLKGQGYIPGVIYNNNGESIPVSIESESIKRILNNNKEEIFLDINFRGEHIRTTVREVQRDPLSGDIQHIDLMPVGKKHLH